MFRVVLKASQTSKIESFFVEMVSGFKPFYGFAKSSILDVWLGSECAPGVSGFIFIKCWLLQGWYRSSDGCCRLWHPSSDSCCRELSLYQWSDFWNTRHWTFEFLIWGVSLDVFGRWIMFYPFEVRWQKIKFSLLHNILRKKWQCLFHGRFVSCIFNKKN